MGAIWVSVTTWLVLNGASFALKILLGLGFGIATYSGAEFLITEAETYIYANFSGLPSKAYSMAVLFGFSEGLHIMFAAFTARISIMVTMGAFQSWTNRPSSFRA